MTKPSKQDKRDQAIIHELIGYANRAVARRQWRAVKDHLSCAASFAEDAERDARKRKSK